MGKVLDHLKLDALFPAGRKPLTYAKFRRARWLEKRLQKSAPEPRNAPRYELPTCFICGKHGTTEHHTCGAGAGPTHVRCGEMIAEAFRRCPRGCRPTSPGGFAMDYKRGDLTKIACKTCGATLDLLRRIRRYVTEGVPA